MAEQSVVPSGERSLSVVAGAASLLADPADPRGFPAVVAAQADAARVMAWARRYCCVCDDIDPLALRRIVEASQVLGAAELARWANASSGGRRHPWALVAAILHVKRAAFVDKLARVPLKFDQMGDAFSRLVCALSRRPVPASVQDARLIAHLQLVTASLVLEAGYVREYEDLTERMSRFNIWIRGVSSRGGERFLDRTWCHAVGHVVLLAHVLAGQKRGMLDGRSSRVPDGSVGNAYLFDLVARTMGNVAPAKGADHFFEIHSSGTLEEIDGTLCDAFEMCGIVADAVDPETGALLSVPDADRRVLDDYLASVGHPAGQPYVTVHCREDGYRSTARHRPRNARIADCLPALDRLIADGFTVVRLGDPSMTRLPERPGLVDYAHSPAKSGKLDVLLAAGAAFHIGSSSGMSLVPLLFGRPCLFLNWYPTTMLPWGPRTWTVLKSLVDIATGGRVAGADRLYSVGKIPDAAVLRELGYAIEDLSPAEIEVAVNAYREFLRDGPAGHEPASAAPVFRFDPDRRLVRVPARRQPTQPG